MMIYKYIYIYYISFSITAYTRPFVFRVVTDANDGDPISTEKLNRGFHLLYSQLPCVNFGKK